MKLDGDENLEFDQSIFYAYVDIFYMKITWMQ